MIENNKLKPLLLLLLTSFALSSACAAPAKLLPFWNQSDENNTQTIDHSAWQQLLDRYLVTETADNIYRFKYADVTAQDKQRLTDYLNALQALDPRKYSRNVQLAYWINLYNALTVDLILKHYPVESIRDIREGGIFDLIGPWNDDIAEVAGKILKLDDIEHGILRPIWQDNRIHYAVNCASLGCPNLWPLAYTAENTETVLEKAARAYVNHPRGTRFDGEKLVVSSIYDWYQVDFGDSEAGVIAHLQKYAAPELKAKLAAYQGSLHYEYDWNLNEPN